MAKENCTRRFANDSASSIRYSRPAWAGSRAPNWRRRYPEAGGLGVIGAGSTLNREGLLAEINGVRERTDKPFGVDILFATIRAGRRRVGAVYGCGAGYGRGGFGGKSPGARFRSRQPEGGGAGSA